MAPQVVRPSMKTVWLWYGVAAVVVVAGVWLYNTVPWFEDKPAWLMAIPALLFLIPLKNHFSTRLIALTLYDDRVTVETGLLSRQARTLDIGKIAEVCVNQTLWQRLIGVGDLGLQITGEHGTHYIHGIDQPRQIEDAILRAKRSPARGPRATAS